MMNKHLWMSICLATALAGCAHDGQAQRHGGGQPYSGSYDNPQADGGAITVVARDASGAIIASAFATVDQLDPGTTSQFEAMFYEVMPEGTTYEGYAISY